MKVLLARDVPGLGEAGTVHEVSEGYARNYLLPRRCAVPATADNERRLAAEKKRHAAETEAHARSIRETAERLAGKSVHVRAKVNEQGTLFGSIGPAQIAAAILEELGIEVAPERIEIAEPFKSPDTYPATVRFPDGAACEIKVWVLPE